MLAVIMMYMHGKIRQSHISSQPITRQRRDAKVSFQKVIARLESEDAVLGILTFIVTAKLFRLIRFNPVNQHVVETSTRHQRDFFRLLLFCY